MHFGRVETVSDICFAIPPNPLRTEKFLALAPEYPTKTYVGCPIWAASRWVGDLYPKGTKPSDFLKVYSKRFPTVEVNSTFYHPLPAERIAQWRDETEPGFRFCPKVYRGITEHLGGSEMPALVSRFCEGIDAFGDRLGLCFSQFSEAFGPSEWGLLDKFLRVWPSDLPLAIELRHRQWFEGHALRDEVVNLFYRRKVATVITDTPGRQDVLHLSLTQPRVLIRFQGHSGDPTDELRLQAWGERLREWANHHVEEIYFFAHQPTEDLIPLTARRALQAITGEELPPLESSEATQLELV